ncbi:hypothetical protein [Legionella fallonii]|uniref:Uncharacterized protein n=1 Tax=Legionella fallonii LLAP-10 TaxID=1212491 RepID=A0A098G274_9GAMM|nr:hypothetical protein [Legionella fallonii]CEG56086.1 conserved protein of unknown function [Legionella fallonii LLAP-10]
MSKEKICKLMAEVVSDINERIVKCNNPHDKERNRLYKPLVLIVQNACDGILSDSKKSILERILLCSMQVNRYNAGNCMLQSFAVFDQLIKKFIASGLADMTTGLPIGIFTTNDHAFVMVGDLVCDSWANYVGPWEKCPFAKEKVKCYFSISSDWVCYDNGKDYDEASTQYTYSLVEANTPVSSTADNQDNRGGASLASIK